MPTAYVNRFLIAFGDMVRISFFDQSGDPNDKTAVALSPSDAIELAELILKLAEQAKAKKP